MSDYALREFRKRELRSVMLQILKHIRSSHTWSDVKAGADAMFHARLVWDRYNEACERDSSANTTCQEQSDA